MGAVAVTAAVVGGYYGLDIVLDETLPIPEPTPIIEPLNDDYRHLPLIEGPEDHSNKITIGQSQPPAPSSNTEEIRIRLSTTVHAEFPVSYRVNDARSFARLDDAKLDGLLDAHYHHHARRGIHP